MAFRAILSVFCVLCALQLITAQLPPLKITSCKRRSIKVLFRAEERPTVSVYRACGFTTGPTSSSEVPCGGPFNDKIRPWCSKQKCPPGVRCKYCGFRVNPRAFPRFYHNLNGTTPTLGRYFFQLNDPDFCSGFVLQIDSDFENSGEEWFARNGFDVGCKDRVNCFSWRKDCKINAAPFDLAIYAQGCDAQLYRRNDQNNNAISVRKCYRGEVTKGIPSGEAVGKDCPLRLI